MKSFDELTAHNYANCANNFTMITSQKVQLLNYQWISGFV